MNGALAAILKEVPAIVSAVTGNPSSASTAATGTTAANIQATSGNQKADFSPAVQKMGKFFMDHGGHVSKVDLDRFISGDQDLKKAYEDLTKRKVLKYSGPVYGKSGDETSFHDTSFVTFTGDPSYTEYHESKATPVNPDAQGKASSWRSQSRSEYHHASAEQLKEAYRNYFGVAYEAPPSFGW